MQGNRSISLGSNITRTAADLEVGAAELMALAAVAPPVMCVGEVSKEGRPRTPSHSKVKLVDF